MLKTIYVPVLTYPDGNQESLIEHVAPIATAIGANVDLEFQGVTFPNFSNVLAGTLVDVPGMIAEARSRSSSRRKKFAALVEGHPSRTKIKYGTSDVEVYEQFFPEKACEAARYRDLGIVGLHPGLSGAKQLAEAMIFGSGRPVILVPENLSAADIGNITIAWDGTKVAARAVADALPFLKIARNVTIVTVADEKPLASDTSARLKNYLSTHGITAALKTVPLAGLPIAECLQSQARDNGYGMLVMGGFGHSRVRDFVLGGATRGVLGNLTVPVLVSHC